MFTKSFSYIFLLLAFTLSINHCVFEEIFVQFLKSDLISEYFSTAGVELEDLHHSANSHSGQQNHEQHHSNSRDEGHGHGQPHHIELFNISIIKNFLDFVSKVLVVLSNVLVLLVLAFSLLHIKLLDLCFRVFPTHLIPIFRSKILLSDLAPQAPPYFLTA